MLSPRHCRLLELGPIQGGKLVSCSVSILSYGQHPHQLFPGTISLDPHLGSVHLKPRTATRQATARHHTGLPHPGAVQVPRAWGCPGGWGRGLFLTVLSPVCLRLCRACVSVGETRRHRVPSSDESMKLPKKPRARPFNKVTGPFAGGAEERAQAEEEAPPGGNAEIVPHTQTSATTSVPRIP